MAGLAHGFMQRNVQLVGCCTVSVKVKVLPPVRDGQAALLLFQGQVDVGDLFMFRDIRNPFDVVEKERKVPQLFATLR